MKTPINKLFFSHLLIIGIDNYFEAVISGISDNNKRRKPIAVSGGIIKYFIKKWNIFVNGVVIRTKIWDIWQVHFVQTVPVKNTNLLRVASNRSISVNTVDIKIGIWVIWQLRFVQIALLKNMCLLEAVFNRSISARTVDIKIGIWDIWQLRFVQKVPVKNTSRWSNPQESHGAGLNQPLFLSLKKIPYANRHFYQITD